MASQCALKQEVSSVPGVFEQSIVTVQFAVMLLGDQPSSLPIENVLFYKINVLISLLEYAFLIFIYGIIFMG